MTITEVGQKYDMTADTLRYYERIGLIPPVNRNGSGVMNYTTDEVRNHANTYLTITAVSIPFLALYNSGTANFRTMGNAKLPMKIMLAMNIAHAIGNAVLIYGFHFGTEGVAVPTTIARIAAGVIIIILALNKKQPMYIKRSFKHKFNWPILKRILSIGVPYGLENGLFYFGLTGLSRQLFSYGGTLVEDGRGFMRFKFFYILHNYTKAQSKNNR